ncbi:hypothetical protein O0I10_008763 [Lichtheimia ornata]|uniref:Uncharacterized protein n=1 Tax=Lichtheimia ornata TaxID=688661 RepID=A0AAD7XZ81_9FUNG|nr:uncharacterized protein O0I10_008763 [Lichtheimia ornata]KAJ8655477.1 hypothetical protein O0I10_008763 [Lichtheimia ornata]
MEEPQHQPSTHGTATDTTLTESLPMTKPETTCNSDSPLSSGVSSSSSAQEETTLPSAGPCIVDSQPSSPAAPPPAAAAADNSNEQDAIPKPSNAETLEHDDCPLDTDTCLPLDTDEQQSHTEDEQQREDDDSRLDQDHQVTHDASSSSSSSSSSSPRQDHQITDSATHMETPLHEDEDHAQETPIHCIEEDATTTPDQQSLKEEEHSGNTQEESGNESVDQQHEQPSTPREPTISQENEMVDQQHDEISQQLQQYDPVATTHLQDEEEEQEQMTTTTTTMDTHGPQTSSSSNDNNGSGPTPPPTIADTTPQPIIHPPTPSPPPAAPPSSSSPEQLYQDGPLSMQHQEPDLSLTLDTRSRHLDNNQDCVTHDDESEHTVLDTHRRVWEADRHASECRRCNRRFNFLVRRHHCRRCGLVVCDRCSSHRIRLPPNEIIQDPAVDPSHYPLIAMHPQRVCDACVRLPIKEVPSSSSSNTRRRATAPVTMRRSGSSQSLMSECPVCGHDLLGMAKKDQENHLQMCLNAGSPPVRPPRYLVYELSSDSPEISYECPICFEEFKAGEKIARMICLCSYHRHCLAEWLERGKGCPVHYDPAL